MHILSFLTSVYKSLILARRSFQLGDQNAWISRLVKAVLAQRVECMDILFYESGKYTSKYRYCGPTDKDKTEFLCGTFDW